MSSPRLRLLLPATLLSGCVTPPDSSAEIAVPQSVEAASAEGELSSPSTTPALTSLLAQISKDRRQFEVREPGVLGAHIPGLFDAELSAIGLRALREGDALSLRTVALQAQSLHRVDPALGACTATSEQVGPRCAPSAELAHGPLTEWWTSGPDGVRHGWTLPASPDGATELRLSLAVDEGGVLGVDPDGTGATLLGSGGGLWRYEDLLAWDAEGQLLAASLLEVGRGLELVVDLADASWPVTIDPVLKPIIIEETKLTASDGAKNDRLGWAVAIMGDADGDGYDDVVAGAYGDDSSTGSAYVYYGSASGLDVSSEQKITASDAANLDYFARAVAGAGDLDGDGYDDLIIGAHHDDDTASSSGSAYVYYGSATGISASSEQKLEASDAAASHYFGYTVRGAGDVDGDGYDDVAVSAPGDADGGTEAGAVYVYYGSASGVRSSSEDKLAASDVAAGDWFGGELSRAGDLDGDGYDDLVVSSWHDADGGTNSGSAYVYYGSSTGISSSSETKLTASDASASAYFAWSVAGGGDLDGDGYDDLAVGAYLDSSVLSSAGAVYVYYGSASGVQASSEVRLDSTDLAASDYLGGSLALGDVDGDGVHDLVTTAYGDDDMGSDSGSVYVWFGGASGVGNTAELKLTASDGASSDGLGYAVASGGDVDGDGRDDVLVGAFGDDDNGSLSGSVYAWSTASRVLASDGSSSGNYGFDVADAGDVNGDGYDDILVTADSDSDNGSSSGAVYVYLGGATGLQVAGEVKLTASDGTSGDKFGSDVAGAGDVDNDGYDDVIIGATGQDDDGTQSGTAYVYLGSATGLVSASEHRLDASDGQAWDGFGYSVAGAGDIDGDGYDDVVVGAYGDDDDRGAAYAFFGSSTGVSLASEQKLTASDRASDDDFGWSVSDAGDLDGDGYMDVIVGARSESENGSYSGAAYVYYGSSTGLVESSELKLLPSDGAASYFFGNELTGGGDLDGDGYDDLAVGAFGSSTGGAVYVYYGSSTGLDLSSEQIVTPESEASTSVFGHSLSLVEDLDGDGLSDLVVGNYKDSQQAKYAGAVHVFYGSSSGIDADTEQILFAPDASRSDYFGNSVSSAGDLNGDGLSDVVVGADGVSVSGSDVGAAYVFGGGCRDLDQDGSCSSEDCDDFDADRHPDAVETPGDGFDSDCDGMEACYVDADGDGHASGTSTTTDLTCSATGLASSVSSVDDCDDSDAAIHPEATEGVGDEVDSDCDGGELCYADADDDGYIDGSTTVTSSDVDCVDSGEGLATDLTGECDDSDATIHPAATEGVGDEVDQDCDGGEICYVDADGDGYTDGVTTVDSSDEDCSDSGEGLATDPTGECDDDDASVHPGATEVVGDEVDSDCDGLETCYADIDDDGYIDGSTTVSSSDEDCSDTGEGLATDPTGECDDSDATIHPGATEGVGDEVDQDCDGGEVCYADADDDGYIDGFTTVASMDVDCVDSGEGLATDPTGECDDDDATIHPGATEGVGNEVDQDCDGGEVCFADADDDGYIDGSTTVVSTDSDCVDAGEGSASDPTGECDDSDAAINPGAAEVVGDEVDSDCDGVELCYVDADDDGVTLADATVESTEDADCADPGEGLSTDPTDDCDDTGPTIYPGAPESVGDEVDSDCDGQEYCYADADEDGFTDGSSTVLSEDTDCADAGEGLATDATGECDDTDPDVNPGAAETVGDEVDSDCDGQELCYVDADGDGFSDGSTVSSVDADCGDVGEVGQGAPLTDCDDSDVGVNPDATEVCDSDHVDEDCDGLADDADGDVDSASLLTFYADADGDGFGDPASTSSSCDAAEGFVADGTDCDDSDPDTLPGGEEIAGDGVDQDCDGADAEDAVSDRDGEGKGGSCASVQTSSGTLPALLLSLASLFGRRRRGSAEGASTRT